MSGQKHFTRIKKYQICPELEQWRSIMNNLNNHGKKKKYSIYRLLEIFETILKRMKNRRIRSYKINPVGLYIHFPMATLYDHQFSVIDYSPMLERFIIEGTVKNREGRSQ